MRKKPKLPRFKVPKPQKVFPDQKKEVNKRACRKWNYNA